MAEPLTLEAARAALLLLDFQNDIVAKGGKRGPDDPAALARFQAAMQKARRAAEAARASGIQVVRVAVGRRAGAPPFNPHAPLFKGAAAADALVEGTHGFAFHEGMEVQEGDLFVVKRGVSAFAGTELAQQLQGRGIDTVMLGGVVTHFAVEGTARQAADLGYRVIVLKDACASGDPKRHEIALDTLSFLTEIVTTDELVAALGG